jgi:ATP-dependent RNA helicase DeaD
MGFIDDIKWVMEHIPQERQIALFSATMPSVIKKVAEKFINRQYMKAFHASCISLHRF